jgi:hypothetical protein
MDDPVEVRRRLNPHPSVSNSPRPVVCGFSHLHAGGPLGRLPCRHDGPCELRRQHRAAGPGSLPHIPRAHTMLTGTAAPLMSFPSGRRGRSASLRLRAASGDPLEGGS